MYGCAQTRKWPINGINGDKRDKRGCERGCGFEGGCGDEYELEINMLNLKEVRPLFHLYIPINGLASHILI